MIRPRSRNGGRAVTTDSPRTGADRIAELEATVAEQQAVISALVAAAETSVESVTRLGTQQVVESRVARMHHAERVLRSVIDSLEGALCIVAADGSVIDANQNWFEGLELIRILGPRGDDGPDGGAPADAPPLGGVGSDFFAVEELVRGAADLEALSASVMAMVRELIDQPPSGTSSRPGPAASRAVGTVARDRSMKAEIRLRGVTRWLVVRVHPVRDHERARAVVRITDITDGMRTQNQLRAATEEAQRLALVAKATPNGVLLTTPDGTIEWVNEAFVKRSRFRFEEAVGRTREELVAAAHRSGRVLPELAAFLRQVVETQSGEGEFLLPDRAGDHYWASIGVRPAVEAGRVSHLVWVEQDVTARRLAQQHLKVARTRAEQLASALSQEKSLLTSVISAVPQMVFWKDSRGRFVGCNKAYLDFRGVDRADGPLVDGQDELDAPDDAALVFASLESEVMTTGAPIIDRTVDLLDAQGRRHTFLLSVLPLVAGGGSCGVIGVGADITHVRELERQVAQSNRLESIGQLAAGIAHEINTPIQYVTDNVHFLTDVTGEILAAARVGSGEPPDAGTAGSDLPDLDVLSQEIPAALAACDEGLTRVTQIVRAMKDYAHPGTGRAQIDVNRAVESTVQVCRNEWKYVADVDLDLAPDAGTAPCFEGELKQVILNMVVNAAQAIAEDHARRGVHEHGSITISTRREREHLVITIADDGPGMDENVARHAFDPFFTTKPVGKGTGQGLGLAHAVIVTKHRGRIDLFTRPGDGARFDLYLPLEVPPAGDAAASAVSFGEAGDVAGGAS